MKYYILLLWRGTETKFIRYANLKNAELAAKMWQECSCNKWTTEIVTVNP